MSARSRARRFRRKVWPPCWIDRGQYRLWIRIVQHAVRRGA
jgi:hypothetical protein